jgi:hypothetical protein
VSFSYLSTQRIAGDVLDLHSFYLSFETYLLQGLIPTLKMLYCGSRTRRLSVQNPLTRVADHFHMRRNVPRSPHDTVHGRDRMSMTAWAISIDLTKLGPSKAGSRCATWSAENCSCVFGLERLSRGGQNSPLTRCVRTVVLLHISASQPAQLHHQPFVHLQITSGVAPSVALILGMASDH